MSTPADISKRRLTRRVMLLGGIQATAFLGLAGRLAHLQFLHADTYKMQSEENRIKLQVVPPIRGVMLDRTGEALAENKVNYRLFVDFQNRSDAIASMKRVAKLLAFDEELVARLEAKLKQQRRRVPVLLKENLPWDQVVRTEFHLPELPNIFLEEGQLRYYPLGAQASHLIGYVGRIDEKDIEKDPSLKRLHEFKIGKSGLERRYENRLRGEAGTRQLEVNARGVSVRELNYTPFEVGVDTKLTIDSVLQRFAAERLGEESGSIVVMDAQQGEMLCCVSMPSYDANEFSEGISSAYWKSLLENERNPLLNKAFSGIYPPASTYKMIVGLAGLASGEINENTYFYCPGSYTLGNRRFNCWKAGGHGHMNLRRAIAESCDTYFYHVGERIGIEAINDMARRCGLGQRSGLDIVGEKEGLLPTDEWKRRVHDTPWVKGDTINASIGQGFVLATPMQLAIMTARLVSGKAIMPQMIKQSEQAKPGLLEIDTSHLKAVMQGMNDVSNASYGTAYWRRILEEGMEMGGKTGTAQVKRILRRGVDQSTLPWRHRHHGLFVGYAPIHNPRFVVSVVVEHGGGGSAAAAPIARDVLLKVQQRAQEIPQHYRF